MGAEEVTTTTVRISRILNECQHSLGVHARRIKELVALRSERPKGFLADLWTCLLPVLTVFKREPAMDRVVKFVAAFAAYRDERHGKECDAFLEEFFGVLLFATEVSGKSVRLRACQILSEVMMRLQDDSEVSDELWDEMIKIMQTRMHDKLPIIRLFAARALARFANVDNSGDIENDPIVSCYRQALQQDQNAEVRKTVILSMPPSNATAVDIVRHTADANESVRKAAFTVLANKFPIQSLSIKQRTTILHRGLHDRVSAIRNECIKMLKDTWLLKCCQSDVISLLKYLDVETNEAVCESAMLALLKENLLQVKEDQSLRNFAPSKDKQETGNEVDVPLMEPEEALYWRMLCNHLHSEAQVKSHDAATTGGEEAAVNAAVATDKNDLLEKVLPETASDYVEIVQKHLNAGLNYRFATRQLLLLGKFLDFSDATNWKSASALVQSLLRLPAEHGHLEETDILVGDGLSLGGDKEWANAVTELAHKVYVAPGEFVEVVACAASDLGKPCREGGADIMQWINCLSVIGLLLESVKSLHQLSGCAIDSQEILNGLLLPAAKHIHPEVQRSVQRCFSLFYIRDARPNEEVVRHLRLALCKGLLPVQSLAAKALFDIVMWDGATVVDKAIGIGPDLGPILEPLPATRSDAEIDEVNQTMPVLELLASILNSDEIEDSDIGGEHSSPSGVSEETLKGIVAEGFAKLLLQSKVYLEVSSVQPRLLSRLLQLYFDQETENMPRLRQCLSVFFNTYPSISLDHKKCVLKAFIPVLRSEWPGLKGSLSVANGQATAKKKRAVLMSKFMLQMLHQPLFNAEEQASVENGVCPQNSVSKIDDIGYGELAIRLALEVIESSCKRSAASKAYMAMLVKVMASLDLRSSENDVIKCMRKLIDNVKECIVGDKLASKELEGLATRLKEMDSVPEQGLSDEQVEILLKNMELELCKQESPSLEEPTTPVPTQKRAPTRRQARKVVTTPDSCSPVLKTPVVPYTGPRSQRACKTVAMGRMRSDLTASKRAAYEDCSDEEKDGGVSSPSLDDDQTADSTDSEFEIEQEEGSKEDLHENPVPGEIVPPSPTEMEVIDFENVPEKVAKPRSRRTRLGK